MVKKQRAFKRSDRKKQVLETLRIWYETDYRKEATSYQLAKALDMRPEQHFRNLLNEMVDEGLLKVVERDQSGRYTTKFYLLAVSPIITEKFSRRRITVTKRGVAVGQLELFS